MSAPAPGAALAPAPPRIWRKGDRAAFEAVIDREMIERFADLSGDRNPLHVDDAYARRTSFGGRIAHGMIAGALFSRLVGEHLPGRRALYRSQDLLFLAPIPPDTKVRVQGEVTGLDEELSLLTLRTTVTDPSGSPVFVEGTAEVVLRPEPDGDQSPAAGAEPARRGMPLAGRRALVLGGSRGLGREVSLELARQGAAVAVGYRFDSAAARSLCSEIERLGVPALSVAFDLASTESVRGAVEGAARGLDGLDILVLSGHGTIARRGLERGDYAEVLDAFHRSAGALYHAAAAALPSMKAQGKGAIIAVSSTVTLEPPPPAWLAYTVAKSALCGLARSLAVELGPYGIRVNLLSPALAEDGLTSAGPPRIREELAARSPLGRLARAEDVAGAVAFLASDAAGFLTGLNLPVAGGTVL